MLFILGFSDPWHFLMDADWDHARKMQAIVTALLIVALAVAWQARQLARIGAASVVLAAGSVIVLSDPIEHTGLTMQVASNAGMLAIAVWLVRSGARNAKGGTYAAGIALILMTAAARYADLIGSYTQAAGFFAVMATAMGGAGMYWKQREKAGTGKTDGEEHRR